MNQSAKEFRESLQVDQGTQERLSEISKQYNQNSTSATTSESSGGRDRGDEDGPGRQGRESGFKQGISRESAVRSIRSDNQTTNSISRASSVLSTSSQATTSSRAGSVTTALGSQSTVSTGLESGNGMDTNGSETGMSQGGQSNS